MRRTTRGVAIAVGLAAAATLVAARAPLGGWAIVKVADVPVVWQAGTPLELAWETRQHGEHPMAGLTPSIEAKAGLLTRARGTASERPARQGGGYRGSITFPSPGEWTVTIHGGFGAAKTTLLPIRVVDGPTMARGAATASAWEQGRRAFASRGCVTCHTHDAVDLPSEMLGFAPNLSGARPAAYLARFLRDPSIGPNASRSRMPNLALSDEDVALFAAFLSGEGRQASR